MAARPVAALAVVAAALSLQEPGAAADFPLAFSKADVQGHPLEAEISAYTAYTESQQEELPQFYRGDVEGSHISAAARLNKPEYGYETLPESEESKKLAELGVKTRSSNDGSVSGLQGGSSRGYKIVCYVESWAYKRSPPMDFDVDDFDAHSCTHLIYASAKLDEDSLQINVVDYQHDVAGGALKSFTKMKELNPSMKVMISVGGWNDNGRKYSEMVSTKENRQKFIESTINFMKHFNFDGLNLNWEYPGATDRGGRAEDKENFSKLVEEMSHEFAVHRFVLSAAVPAMRYRISQGYDVKKLSTHLDFISVETFDLRGSWDGFADHHAPVENRTDEKWGYETSNTKQSMEIWVEEGAPRHKLIVGIPFYARTFTLANSENTAPGSQAIGGGVEGPFTRTRGMLSYSEVCQNFRDESWIKANDEVGSPYMYKGDQWIGYDDADYIAKKTALVRGAGYGGAALWALDLDDYHGLCGSRWPLLTAVTTGLSGPYEPQPEAEPAHKVVCYLESWAADRDPPYSLSSAADVDPATCTHVVYAFAGISPDNRTILSLDQKNDILFGGYKSTSFLKRANPELKVMIAVGGWNEGGRKFSVMASTAQNRKKFIDSVVEFLEEYDFDGIALDWEYPGAVDRGGRREDAARLSLLVQELSVALAPRGGRVSLVVPPARYRVDQGYDVPAMARYLDFISVSTYDLRGHWDGFADHHAPIQQRDHDPIGYENLNVKDALEYWVQRGAPKAKLLVGIPFYARTFTLVDPAQNAPGSKVRGGGSMGQFTKDSGILAYHEVCSRLADASWSKSTDAVGSPYIVKDDQWIGYDDANSIALKMRLVVEEGYGGAAVWALDLDDYHGACGQRRPLITAVVNGLRDARESLERSSATSVRSGQFQRPQGKPSFMNAIRSVLRGLARGSPNVRQNAPYTTPYAPPSTTAAPYTPPSTATPYTPPTTASGFVNPWTVANAAPRPSSLRGAPCAMGQFQRHETHCDRFYQCDHGSFIERDCLVGQHWSGTRCDWPEKANCQVEAAALPLPPGVAPLAQHGNAL